MNELSKFELLEDLTIPDDALWMRSFETYRRAVEGYLEEGRGTIIKLLNPADGYSLNYDACWNGEFCAGQTYWIPGYKVEQREEMSAINKTTGKRSLRTIAYLLSHTEDTLRGSKIIQCCGNPYCINPAHSYKVTNKYKLYDQVYMGVTPEEWEEVRGEIIKLEHQRQAEQDTLEILSAQYAGTTQNKMTYMNKMRKENAYHDLTNDQIATMAIQRKADRVNTSEEFGTLDSFLEKYQMKTLYFRTSQEFKDMMQEIIKHHRTSKYMSREQLYSDALTLAARLFENDEFIQVLQNYNLESIPL